MILIQSFCDTLVLFSIYSCTSPTSLLYVLIAAALQLHRLIPVFPIKSLYKSLLLLSLAIAVCKLITFVTNFTSVFTTLIFGSSNLIYSIIPDVLITFASILALWNHDRDAYRLKFEVYQIIAMGVLILHSGFSQSWLGLVYLLCLLCIVLSNFVLMKQDTGLINAVLYLMSSCELIAPFVLNFIGVGSVYNVFEEIDLGLYKVVILLVFNVLVSVLMSWEWIEYEEGEEGFLELEVSMMRKFGILVLYFATVFAQWVWIMRFRGPERLVFMGWIFFSVIEKRNEKVKWVSRFVLVPSLAVSILGYYFLSLMGMLGDYENYSKFDETYSIMSLTLSFTSLWFTFHSHLPPQTDLWSVLYGIIFTWIIKQIYIFSLIVLFFVGLSDINLLYTGLMAFCIWFVINSSALKNFWHYLLLYNMFILIIRGFWVFLQPFVPYNETVLRIIGLPVTTNELTVFDYLLWLLFLTVSIQHGANQIEVETNARSMKFFDLLRLVYDFVWQFEIWVMYAVMFVVQNLGRVNYLNSMRLGIILLVVFKHLGDVDRKIVKGYRRVYALVVVLEVYSGVLLAVRYVYQFLKFIPSAEHLEFPIIGFEIYEVKELYKSTATDCILLVASVFASRNCYRLQSELEVAQKKNRYKIFKKYFSNPFVYFVLTLAFCISTFVEVNLMMFVIVMSISLYQISMGSYFDSISQGEFCRSKTVEWQRRAFLWRILFTTTLLSLFFAYFVFLINNSYIPAELLLNLELIFFFFGFNKATGNALLSSQYNLLFLLALIIERHCLQYNLPSKKVNSEKIQSKESLKEHMNFIRVLTLIKSISEALIPVLLLLIAFYKLNIISILYVSLVFISFCTSDLIHQKLLFLSANILSVIEYFLLAGKIGIAYSQILNIEGSILNDWVLKYPGLVEIGKLDSLGIFYEFIAEIFMLAYFNYLSYRERQLLEIEAKYRSLSSDESKMHEEQKSEGWIASLKDFLIKVKKNFYLISRYLLVGIALLFITQSLGLLSIFYYIFLLVFILKENSIYLSKNISSYLKLVIWFLRFLVFDLTLQIFIQFPFALVPSNGFEMWCKCIGLLKLTGNDLVSESNIRTIMFKIYTFFVVLMLQRMMKSKDYEEYLCKFFLDFEEKSKAISEEKTKQFNNERIRMNKFYAESNTRFEGELMKIEGNIETWKKKFRVGFIKSHKADWTLNSFSVKSLKHQESCVEEEKQPGFMSKLNSYLVSFVDPHLFENFLKKITVFNRGFTITKARSCIRGVASLSGARRFTDKDIRSRQLSQITKKTTELTVLQEKDEHSDSGSDSDSSSGSSSSSDSSNLSVKSLKAIDFADSIETEKTEYSIGWKDYILIFIYSLASNTEGLVYVSFIINNWSYCSIESVVYPLSALSYAVLIYPRPSSKYFRVMLYYTITVFFLKLLVQLEVWSIILGSETLNNYKDPFKTGFNLAKNTYSETLLHYILWDVVVMITLLFHNFYLIKVGLWEQSETEIEDLNEAKERVGLKSRGTFSKKQKKTPSLIENLLPTNKEEKPGKDFYHITITVQMLVLVYIFCFFTRMDGNSQDISQAIRSNQFQGRMIITLVLQLSLIIIERYFYVSRTSQALTEAQKSKESMTSQTPVARYRSSTSYGEEISSKLPRPVSTPKGQNPFTFIETLKKSEDKQKETKRGFPPVVRVLVFLFLLFAVHFIVFFYLPFNGNFSTYGKVYCDRTDKANRCNDFESNYFIQGFYFLYLVYLVCTALQIKYSLPSFSKVTFPLMRNSSQMNYYLFLSYRSAPFLFEIRTLMDWTFSNTALTIFQWFKFEDIYAQLFINECYQKSMSFKEHGERIGAKQKCFMGVCGLFTILVVIFLPLLVFSTLNPITDINPVSSASLSVNFVYEKRSFEIYSIKSAEEIKNITLKDWEDVYKFSQIPQLTISDCPLTQKVIMPIDSDQLWSLSPPAKRKLCNLIRKSQSAQAPNPNLQIKYSFYRNFPVSKPEVSLIINKVIEKHSASQFESVICSNSNSSIEIPKVFDEIIRLPSSGEDISPIMIESESFKSSLILSLEVEDGETWWNLRTNKDVHQSRALSFFTISDTYSIVTLNFSILTFYISVVYVVGTLIKYVTKGSGMNVVMTDMKHTKDLQVLCEGIYISRMIGKLKEEEELYFELLDIMRSPEITKMITGPSSIKCEEVDKKNR